MLRIINFRIPVQEAERLEELIVKKKIFFFPRLWVFSFFILTYIEKYYIIIYG